MDLIFDDPPRVTDSLDFFRHDFLGISGRSLEGESFPGLDSFGQESFEWCRLGCLDLVDGSFFFGDSFVLRSVEGWRLDDFGNSWRSRTGDFDLLLHLPESARTKTLAINESKLF